MKTVCYLSTQTLLIIVDADTVEFRNYPPPPPLCMLALDKTGEGAYSRDSDIYL